MLKHIGMGKIVLTALVLASVSAVSYAVDDTTNPVSFKHDHHEKMYVDAEAPDGSVIKLSQEEYEMLKTSRGPNYKGESSDFNSYLNSGRATASDDDISILETGDPNAKVVLGADDAPAGVSFKMNFNNSPLE